MLAWHLGKRCNENTVLFAEKLAAATMGRFQLTTDGYRGYTKAIPVVLPEVDFAQLVKHYAIMEGQKYARGKYSPAEVSGTTKTPVNGNPDEDKISTSHVERANLTIRMQNRRMTRLTNAFSKKWDNHAMAISLQFVFCNFCRPHMTLSAGDKENGIKGVKTTPAMAAKLTDHVWTIEELVRESSTLS